MGSHAVSHIFDLDSGLCEMLESNSLCAQLSK